MAPKAYLGVTVDSKLFEKIEALRGREKRSTFVEHLLWLGLEAHLRMEREPKIRRTQTADLFRGSRIIH